MNPSSKLWLELMGRCARQTGLVLPSCGVKNYARHLLPLIPHGTVIVIGSDSRRSRVVNTALTS
jgi:hypothetical protein